MVQKRGKVERFKAMAQTQHMQQHATSPCPTLAKNGHIGQFTTVDHFIRPKTKNKLQRGPKT